MPVHEVTCSRIAKLISR